MSKILVVEPRKILQQAIRLALCPEHEVKVDAQLSDQEPSGMKDFDLVIIDAAALRDANVLSAGHLRAVQGWQIPKIWIDEPARVQAPGRDSLVVLAKPIQRETLQAAIATCLGASLPGKRNGVGQQQPIKGAAGPDATPSSDSGTTTSPVIIDLVDIVEEPPDRRRHGRQQRKTK